MTGGHYSLTGGFWSMISVVQTAGLPNLVISQAGGNVIISWPATGGYTVQQSPNLATGTWATSGYRVTTANRISSVTISSPTGNLFFRLSNP